MTDRTINKIISKSPNLQESLLDLTSDSVSPENLLLNKTAHNSEGEGIVGEMPEGGARNYDELENRPQINGNLLTGNKTGSQLGLQNRVLASTLNIGGQTIGNVEGALSALNESKSDLVNGKVPVNELPVYQPVIGSIQSIGGTLPPSNPGDEDKYFRADGKWAKPSGGGGGVSDYDDLSNRPKINGTTLSEDKTGTQLGLQNRVLASAMTIGGQTITEVEDALNALNENSSAKDNFIGTKQEWESLTPQEQAKYNTMDFFGDSSSGGGGHTIVNSSGTELTQRSKLQFEGAIVSDDETNDATVVETVNPVEYEEDIEALQNQLTDQTNVLGAKNLIPYPYKETTKTVSGITFTDNGDGTITASGEATADANFHLQTNATKAIKLTTGEKYILSGCPAGGASSKYSIKLFYQLNGAPKYVPTDVGSGATFVMPEYDAGTYLTVFIQVLKGAGTVTNLTFKPMLRLASDPDNTYVPYAMTNRELTEKIANLKTITANASDFAAFKTAIANL